MAARLLWPDEQFTAVSTDKGISNTGPHPGLGQQRRQRDSLLGFKFARHRPKPPPQRPATSPPATLMPIVLPDVIEITAPKVRDDEAEERERFRTEAAQAIGIGLEPEVRSTNEPDEQDDAGEEDAGRTSAETPIPVPPFPSTLNGVDAFVQNSSSVVKYYPPSSSMRMFALSRHWKSRFMVLTAPLSSQAQSPSYLHLFKEEKELERLEINEDSVVFIAEDEIDGKRHVLKVGGTDVGAMRKDLNPLDDKERTMWFLHITDPNQAQKWINTIKNVILGQRSVRAGLGVPTGPVSGVEPRGDMDVMLSMRAQGIISSSPPLPNHFTPPQSPTLPSESSHSIRSQGTSATSTATKAVSALKGLFNSRPRSSSRATSIESEYTPRSDGAEDASFTSFGNNLLMHGGHITRPPLSDVRPHSSLPLGSHGHLLDRKIIPNHSTYIPAPAPRHTRTVFSLQPPPRKRFSAVSDSVSGQSSLHERMGVPSSSRRSTSSRTPSMSSTSVSTFASGGDMAPSEPRQSGEARRSSERTSTRSSRRWSRQLPQRLTPPSGPPPAVPNTPSSRGSGSTSIGSGSVRTHPYANGSLVIERERPPSRGSVLSGSFSAKRTSISSAFSINTMSTSHTTTSSSHVHTSAPTGGSRPSSSHAHRSIPPPPRGPAPTFALPPPPVNGSAAEDSKTQSRSSSPPPSKSRAFRLSLMAPVKPPPSSVLPPRPDEQRTGSDELFSIPQSPLPPPPNWALPTPPPPPPVQLSGPSLKHRLRILSMPTPSMIPLNGLPPTPGTPTSLSSYDPTSFLQLFTPVTPKTFRAPPSPPITTEEFTPLSPPPRRSSNQMSLTDSNIDDDDEEEEEEEKMGKKMADNISLASLGEGSNSNSHTTHEDCHQEDAIPVSPLFPAGENDKDAKADDKAHDLTSDIHTHSMIDRDDKKQESDDKQQRPRLPSPPPLLASPPPSSSASVLSLGIVTI